MKDYPIIFSTPMILALLDGRKTMTRRLAWTDFKAAKEKDRAKLERVGCIFERRGGTSPSYGSLFAARPTPWQRVQPGDRLWVREGWRWNVDYEDTACYRADYPNDGDPPVPELYFRWRSPRHLARAKSRLTLIVTATKMERLHDITVIEAMKEGIERRIEPVDGVSTTIYSDNFDIGASECPRDHFRLLWIWLHGKESWDANPEVVALTFAVHKQNIDALAEAA